MKLKDIYAIENMLHPSEWDGSNQWAKESTTKKNLLLKDRIEQAYEGADILPEFRLYKWSNGAFVVAREPSPTRR